MTAAAGVPPGCYGVVRTSGFLAWVIRKATRSTYNHAFIYLGDGKLIEATPYGVRTASLTEYAGHQMAANTAETVTPAQRDAVVRKAVSCLGEEYNWPDLGVIGLEKLGLHWRILLHLSGGRHALICSQLVCIAGMAAGLDDWLCGEPGPSQVTPADLARRPTVRKVGT